MHQVSGVASVDVSQSGKSLPHDGNTERYVINLSASTTPVVLTPPAQPELRRFSFFVTRKLESGRERFRLHMGYFDSQEEAERMLEFVREVYPAAWAGVAPGQRLRTRAKPAEVSAEPVAATPVPAVAPAVPRPIAELPMPAVVAAVPTAAVIAIPQTANQIASPAAATTATPATAAAAAAVTLPLTLVEQVPPAVAAKPNAAARHASDDAEAAAQSLGQIRATLASLSPPQTLALLETPPRQLSGAVAQPAKSTRAGPQAPAATEAPVYAVQLLWSVQPIDMGKVPRLAIFSAYRLYGAEGNRDGRRWYGLRLGFFADPVSARQVAQYVRSEFSSVSVVPVSERERERASRTAARPMPAAKSGPEPAHGLQFIEEVQTDTATSGNRPALQQTADEAEAAWAEAARTAVQIPTKPRTPATGKRAKLRVGQSAKPAAKPAAKAAAKRGPRRPPETLEQTLEALGASTLKMHEDRGERVVFETTRGTAGAPPPGNSRFGKLLDNLARRFGSV
jgi:hypothetical protein